MSFDDKRRYYLENRLSAGSLEALLSETDFWMLKAFELFDSNKYLESLEFFDESILVDTYNLHARIARANVLYILERYSDAYDEISILFDFNIEGYCESYHLHKDELLLYFYEVAIDILKACKEYPMVLEVCDKYLKINCNNPKIFNIKAFCSYQLNRYYDAKEAYEKSLQIAPNNDKVCLNIAKLYEHFIKCEGSAFHYYEKCLNINRLNEEAWLGHARQLITFGQYNAALESFETCLSINPNNREALIGKAFCLKYL